MDTRQQALASERLNSIGDDYYDWWELFPTALLKNPSICHFIVMPWYMFISKFWLDYRDINRTRVKLQTNGVESWSVPKQCEKQVRMT